MNRHRPAWLLLAPAALLLGVFLLLPYLNIVVISFHPPAVGRPYGAGFTLANYTKILSDPYYAGQIVTTLAIGAATTLACLLLGFPVAWQLARGGDRWRALGYGIVLSPLLVGIVTRSFGWTILLGNQGAINQALVALHLASGPLPLMYNSFGIIVSLTHVLLPLMILPVMGAIQGIDPTLESAARSLGASRQVVFRRVILPLAASGVQSGCILVFVLAISAYVTPALIGGGRVKTLAVTVVDALVDSFQWPFGAALALVLAAVGTLAILVFARLTRPRWMRA